MGFALNTQTTMKFALVICFAALGASQPSGLPMFKNHLPVAAPLPGLDPVHKRSAPTFTLPYNYALYGPEKLPAQVGGGYKKRTAEVIVFSANPTVEEPLVY